MANNKMPLRNTEKRKKRKVEEGRGGRLCGNFKQFNLKENINCRHVSACLPAGREGTAPARRRRRSLFVLLSCCARAVAAQYCS